VTVRAGKYPLKFARLTEAAFTDRLVQKFSLPAMGLREAAEASARSRNPRY
jgi:NAD+ kinase